MRILALECSGDPTHLLVSMRNAEQLWGQLLHSVEEVALHYCHKLLLQNLVNVHVLTKAGTDATLRHYSRVPTLQSSYITDNTDTPLVHEKYVC